jgi:KDO2-lipid IV(A) lauroyltransferase
MAASATPILGIELHIVVKSLKPESLNRWITDTRSRWGTRVHDRRGSVRNLIEALKEGNPIGFIIDQNAKRNWGVFVDFFGRPACTTDGLAQLAAIGGKPIFPVFCRRDPVTRSLIAEIGEEIVGPSDRSPEEIERVTAECTRKLEDFIRKYPDQWIWMHRRWRTRPEAEAAGHSEHH